MEYKCPAGAYPLHDFRKICRVCTPFQDELAVKILFDLFKFRSICSRDYGVMGVLSWWCQVSGKSSATCSGKTVRQTPKSFPGARTCSSSSITMPSLVGLGFHLLPWQPKTLSFLSVCLSVTLLWMVHCRCMPGGASCSAWILLFISINNRST